MGERQRILMITPFPESADKVRGGVEAAAWALANALCERDDVEKILAVGVKTKATPGRTFNDKLEAVCVQAPFVSGDALIRSWFAVQSIRKLARAFRPTVVHAQGMDRNVDIAVQLGLPSVVTVHGMVHVEARLAERGVLGSLKVAAMDRIVANGLAAADVVISISDYDARELAPMIRGPRVSIPNAVPDAFFDAFSQPPEAPVVAFAGVMKERKNIVGLVNGFHRVRQAVPEARLVLAGPVSDPAYRDQVAARVEALGLGLGEAVSFLGHVSNEQLISTLAGASALALFSFEETLPTIIAQAMAVGRPVVASNVGGISGMVAEGETGFLVASGDEEALADRLIALLKDPAMARRFGETGAVAARDRYRAAAIAERTCDAYRLARQEFAASAPGRRQLETAG